MKQVNLAVVKIAILLLLLACNGLFGQNDQNNDGAGKVGRVEVPSEAPKINPPSSPTIIPPPASPAPAPAPTIHRQPQPPWVSREQIEAHVRHGSPRPVVKKTNAHKTVVYAGHKGHSSAYREVKSWNPASRSYVDWRDQDTLGKAKAYTRGYVDGKLGSKPKKVAATPAPVVAQDSTDARDWSWLWGLLAALLIVALLLWLIWLISQLFNRGGGSSIVWTPWVWPWQRRSRARPDPDMVNTDLGDYFGYDSGPARVSLSCDGSTVVKKWKGWADRTSGDGSFRWAAADQTIEGRFKVGSTLAFALSRENVGNLPVSTEGVTLVDDFHATKFGRLVAGSGKLVISGKTVASLDNAFIERLLAGAVIALDEIIDEIPAKSSVNIVYNVICLPQGNHLRPAHAPSLDGEAKQGPRFKLADLLADKVKEPKVEPAPAEPPVQTEPEANIVQEPTPAALETVDAPSEAVKVEGTSEEVEEAHRAEDEEMPEVAEELEEEGEGDDDIVNAINAGLSDTNEEED